MGHSMVKQKHMEEKQVIYRREPFPPFATWHISFVCTCVCLFFFYKYVGKFRYYRYPYHVRFVLSLMKYSPPEAYIV